jgi:hypothetical protein
MAEAHPGKRPEVLGDILDARLADLHPPLPHEGDHPDQRVRVDRRGRRVVTRVPERGGEHVPDAIGELVEQARQLRPRGRRRVLRQHRESIAPKIRALCQQYGQPYTTGSFPKQLASVARSLLHLSLPLRLPRREIAA